MTFVSNSTGKLRKVLLCPPTYFSFQPINEITKAALAQGEEADLEAFKREPASRSSSSSRSRTCPTWSTRATSAPAWPKGR
jgi:hypothetical protein